MPNKNLRNQVVFSSSLQWGDGAIVRRGGVRWTIKDGVVFDNEVLIDEVIRMVDESKQGWTNPVEALFEPLQGHN